MIASLNHLYHLDLPWYEQYATFLNNLLHLDLGLSFTQRGRHVWDILGSGVPISAQIGLTSLLCQVLIGVPVGIIAAVRAGTRLDTASMSFALMLYAIPTFISIPFYQLIMVQLSLHNLPFLPVSGWNGLFDIHAFGPIFLLTLLGLGFYARLTRSTMLEVLGQDYVRTARAKGLREQTVVILHAMRNAMIPVITIIALQIPEIFGGAVITEQIFRIPGIGRALIDGIGSKDVPVVMAITFGFAILVVVFNVIADVLYAVLDPRIRYS
jgi:ABC-type dipeptide/oligopeptide/nickel transport system permease component